MDKEDEVLQAAKVSNAQVLCVLAFHCVNAQQWEGDWYTVFLINIPC